MIRLLDGTEIPCNVKDVSPSGAKLGSRARTSCPITFMLKVIGRDYVCLVRLAWRRGDYAGVRIERVGKLPTADKPVVEKVDRPDAPSDYRTLGSRRSRVSSF